MMTKRLLLIALVAACSKKPAAKTPDSTDTTKPVVPTAMKEEKKAPEVTNDQRVSQGLAISADIAAACGIKLPEAGAAAPTFDYDKEELSPDDRKVLDQIATCLTTGALKGKNVSLIGRADPRGTEEYNLGLGSRRAETVSAYLARSGVTAPQLAVTTRGALDATGTDEQTWAKDRRVDIQMRNDTEAKTD